MANLKEEKFPLFCGAVCSVCGFAYSEYQGHLLPCPRCEADRLSRLMNSQQGDLSSSIRRTHYGTDLEGLQGEVRKWEDHNFPRANDLQQFIGVVEEVGELAHFMLKEMQGIREAVDKYGNPTSTEAHQIDAVGDIAIFLINFCSKKGWSFGRILAETWETVSKRDFVKFPKNGLTE